MAKVTRIQSTVAPLPINDIDTDQIIPARYLKITDRSGLAEGLFSNWRDTRDFVLNQPQYEDAKIDTWVTMGSPLGDSSIRKRLNGAKETLAARFPKNVISWHNVSAEDDYTCHDNTLADDFKKMLSHRVVSAVNDYQIYNLAVRYGKSNPHSSLGYFIHPRVSKIITDWLPSGAA